MKIALSVFSVYDAKAWCILSLMIAFLLIVEVVIKLYHDNESYPAYMAITGMFLFCFYSQGALSGMMLARAITIDKQGTETDSKC